MNKKVEKIVLLAWITLTSFLDLSIGIFAFSIIACINCTHDGIPDYTLSINTLVINQVAISLLVFLFGLVWSSIILLGTERLLVFLNIPTPGNKKFTKLSLGLFKFALITMMLSLLIGNINLIYDQIQGRGVFRSSVMTPFRSSGYL